ncbi:hypothetical protein [Anaerovibrio lipolyticus]|nr:hypothetical protein [Anaerovibrio lipolyticus]
MSNIDMLFSMVGLFTVAAAIPCIFAPKLAMSEVRALVKSIL